MSVEQQQSSLFGDDVVPLPVQGHGKIHIGTSGYIFKDWQGPFYPKGLPQNRWLEYYAQHFGVVEINATYYRILPSSSFEGMVRKTPDGFTFWVKVPSELTHSSTDPLPATREFLNSIQPLIESNRLLGVLAQFPPSFRYNGKNLDRIKLIKEYFKDITLSVEFRSDDWIREETYTFLDTNGIIYVAVDLPEISGLPGMTARVTGAAGYIRFHGRNKETWYNPRAGDRYDYYYSEQELRSWVKHILPMDENAPLTYLFFNNCHAGQAVKNARMMRQILEQELILPF